MRKYLILFETYLKFYFVSGVFNINNERRPTSLHNHLFKLLGTSSNSYSLSILTTTIFCFPCNDLLQTTFK